MYDYFVWPLLHLQLNEIEVIFLSNIFSVNIIEAMFCWLCEIKRVMPSGSSKERIVFPFYVKSSLKICGMWLTTKQMLIIV